jgi:transcriptional regulator with XRE-family HTH domain
MYPDTMTPSEVVLANIQVFMRWRGLTQEDLANRMTSNGLRFDKKSGGRTKWHRRTVGQMLNGERRIDINELLGLAVALETTAGALLSPRIGGVLDIGMRYVIGDLDPIGFNDLLLLLTDPEEKELRPRLVIEQWPTGQEAESVPKWVDQKALFNEKLAVAIEEFRSSHPEASTDVSDREILNLMAQEWEARRQSD